MGQYHYLVNLDKFEFIAPHKIGVGLKAGEQGCSSASTPQLLFALVMCSNGRGGGDFPDDHGLCGRWAGDRIAVVGDYAEDSDLDERHAAGSIYNRCGEDKSTLVKLAKCADGVDEAHYAQDPKTAKYRDISDLCVGFLEDIFGVRVDTSSDGWRDRKKVSDGW